MFERPSSPSGGLRAISAAAFALVLAALGGLALAQQDKYALSVPGGLAFSEFRGYEGWGRLLPPVRTTGWSPWSSPIP
jgi:hypothetical protein